MTPEINPDHWLLAYVMSSISERCYYATWMDNLEYVLWHAVEEGPRRYGHDEINTDDITALKMLSKRCEKWIFFDDVDEETVIPLDLWREEYAHHISKNPRALV
jgi:hypothetical protein